MREISLMYLLDIAWRKIWILILAFALSASLAFGYCKLIAAPKYTAKIAILATNGGMTSSETVPGNGVSNGDIAASINIVATVVDILKTDDIYKQLAAEMGSGYTYSELSAKAKVEARGEKTMFIDVSFTAETKEKVLRLVNCYAELAPDYIADSIPNSYTKCYVTEKAEQTYPTTVKTTVLVAFIGAAAAYLIVLMASIFDRAIKGEEDYTARFDVSLIGAVPDFESVSMSSMQYTLRGGDSK